jgi:hypothetical protein
MNSFSSKSMQKNLKVQREQNSDIIENQKLEMN